jgi:hypothetical protein
MIFRTLPGWLATAFLLTPLYSFAQSVLWERSFEGAVSRGVFITSSEFTDESLRKLCLRALEAKVGVFLHIAIITEPRQRFLFSFVSDLPLDAWRVRCERAATEPARLAELVSIGNDSVLRIRDGLTIRHITLSGDNPLRYKNKGAEFEIRNIALTPRSAFTFVVYAQAIREFSVTGAQDFFDYMRKRLPDASLHLTIRKDQWFSSGGLIAPCLWAAGTVVQDSRPIDMAPEIICPNLISNELKCRGYRLY